MPGYTHNKRYNYWVKETPRSQNVITLFSPKQTIQKKWVVRSERGTRSKPGRKGVDRFFNKKSDAVKFINQRIKK